MLTIQKPDVPVEKVIAVLVLALAVGYAVSFASTLWMEYKYAWTLDTPGHPPNEFGGTRQHPKPG